MTFSQRIEAEIVLAKYNGFDDDYIAETINKRFHKCVTKERISEILANYYNNLYKKVVEFDNLNQQNSSEEDLASDFEICEEPEGDNDGDHHGRYSWNKNGRNHLFKEINIYDFDIYDMLILQSGPDFIQDVIERIDFDENCIYTKEFKIRFNVNKKDEYSYCITKINYDNKIYAIKEIWKRANNTTFKRFFVENVDMNTFFIFDNQKEEK